MNENFLLKTEQAQRLFHSVENLPVIDFHNHLSVEDLGKDRVFSDITELWVQSDPYKHRAMRILGVDEHYITGKASNYEKFQKWAESVPMLVGNPLFAWTQMELKRVFGIEEALNGENAKYIWDTTNEMLASPEYSNNSILRKFQVQYAAPCCTIGESVDFLASSPSLAPSLRGDDLLLPTQKLAEQLTAQTGTAVNSLQNYLAAVSQRLDVFHRAGCRFSDHALDDGFRYMADDGKNEERFLAAIHGDKYDQLALQSWLLTALAGEYAKRHWTMQLHIGAHRRTSDRLASIAGPAGGYAAAGAGCDIASVIELLNHAEKTPGGLPKTIVFPLNPTDSAAMAILSGSFSESGTKAKVQLGPAWWWCDHQTGIRNVLDAIASYGVLSTFVGMTTDSRSILSFVRHEYFRRILCDWMGDKMVSGQFPEDLTLMEEIARKICYENAAELI